MATTNLVRAITLIAGAGITDSQFTFVNINASGQVVQVAATGGRVTGVLMDRPGQNAGTGTNGADESTGFEAEVGLLSSGILKVVAGGTITAGQEIKSDGSGHAISAATEVNNHFVVGIATTSAADGELVEFTPLTSRQAA